MRGDCGFGNEPSIVESENRGQSYLFKLRQTSGVKKMLMGQFVRKDWTSLVPAIRDGPRCKTRYGWPVGIGRAGW